MRQPNPHTLRIGANDVFDNAGAAAQAVITVGAKVANVRNITIQLNDGAGVAVTSRKPVRILMLGDALGASFAATGGSTGLAQGTDGTILAVVAKKVFEAISKNNGSITLTYTDTGSEAVWLAVAVAGKLVISAAL